MAAPYDTIESALNLARVRLNDAIGQGLAGEVMTDTQPFTPVVVQGAWRRLQDLLVDMGAGRFENETVLYLVPAISSADGTTRISISWTGFVLNGSPLPTPVLPQDLIYPLELRERASGDVVMIKMDAAKRGIPDVAKTRQHLFWEWREDAIYTPGATVLTDLKVRYTAYLPDLVAPFSSNVIPIMRALSPLAWMIAYEMASARGGPIAASFAANAKEESAFILTREPDFPHSSERAPKPPSLAELAGGKQ